MSFISQQPRNADFILSEGSGQRSRENVVIAAGSGIVLAGTLIALITTANAATVTPAGGNTGNGVMGAVTVSSEAASGTYTVAITAEDANGGTFVVTGPTGAEVGTGTVGAAFNAGGLAFTLADGSTDFAVGDSWSVAVLANLGEWVPYDDDGTNDGRRSAGGVLYASVDATDTDVQGVALVRDAEVAAALLIGLDAPGRADLTALGVIVRD